MSSHSTVLINSHSFQHAKELPRSSCQRLFLQIQWLMAENLQLLSKTPHHHLLLPGCSALPRRAARNAPLQEPLARRSSCHGSNLLHSGGLISPAKLHPRSTAARHLHSLTKEAFLDGGMAHTYPHIEGLDVQPYTQGAASIRAITSPMNSSPCNAEYYGILVIITQLYKCLQDQNLPV